MILALSLLAPGQGIAQASAPDPLDRVAELLSEGRAEEASALIEATPLPADRDGAAAHHFARGMAALMLSRPQEAIGALGAALELRPDLAGARVALGRAYALAGDAERSEMQLRRALAGAGDDARRRVVESDLAALRANRRLIGSFSFGIVPDSNVGARTSASTIVIDGLPFDLSEAARRSAGLGLQLSGQVAAFAPISDGVRLSAGLGAWHINYEGSRFDDLITRLRVGPEIAVGRGSVAFGPVGYRRWYGGRGYSHSIGGFVETQQPIGTAMLLGGVVEAVRVTHDDLSLRDADAVRLDLVSAFVLSPTLRLRLGGGVGRETAEASVYSYWSYRGIVGLLADLPGGFGVALSHEVLRRDYEAPDFFETKPRRELRNTSRIEISNRRIAFAGLMPAFAVSHEDQDATSALFAYRRLRAEVTLTRDF
jgi:hypothetical protein